MPINRWHRTAGLAVAAVISLAGVACGDDSPADGGGSGGNESATIIASNFAFDPTSVSVESAGTVAITLQNEDDTQHSITIDDADFEIVADGGSSASGDLTIEEGASLDFHCKFHETMTGVIALGGAAGAGGNPSSEDDSSYDY